MNINKYKNYLNDIDKISFINIINNLNNNLNLKKLIEFFIMNNIKFYNIINNNINIKDQDYLLLIINKFKNEIIFKLQFILLNNIINNKIETDNIEIIKYNLNYHINYLHGILLHHDYIKDNFNNIKDIFINYFEFNLENNFIAIYKNE